jgi:chromosomal replication initiator protein
MLWERVKAHLQETLTDNIYQLWIDPIEELGLQGELLYLTTPDRYFSAYVKHNFLELIQAELAHFGYDGLRVSFCEGEAPTVMGSVGRNGSKQLRLPCLPEYDARLKALHPRYTFDEFMVGESNILAESACRSMVADNDLVGSCLYINSDTGLGKSHLTHAVAHQIFADAPMTRLHYLSAQQFASEMVQNIQARTMDVFKRKYQENCDFLLVEDVHSLVGKKKSQEELNELLDTLIKCGKRVILTAKKSPRELDGIDSEFRSRMASGLVTTINAPDIATRVRIVEKKATQQQLLLGEEQVDYLANHIRGDIRQIESALIAIRAKASLMGGVVELELVKSVVESIIGYHQQLTAAMISELVGGQFNVSLGELQSRSRKKCIAFPRQVAMYLARKHTDESLTDIGKVFNRDHSTVLHAIKVVNTKLIRDNSVNAQVALLDKKIKQL